MNGLVQGTGPCTFWSILGDSPSQDNSEGVRGSLMDSVRRLNNSVGHLVTGRVNCTYCTPGFGPQSLHTITLLLSRALAVARA